MNEESLKVQVDMGATSKEFEGWLLKKKLKERLSRVQEVANLQDPDSIILKFAEMQRLDNNIIHHLMNDVELLNQRQPKVDAQLAAELKHWKTEAEKLKTALVTYHYRR